MNIEQHIRKIGGIDKLPKEKHELAKGLMEIEEKYKKKSLVCDEFQLGRDEQGFSLEMKKMRRRNTVTEVEFFVKTNWDSVSNGRLFIINEELTAKNIEAQAQFKVAQNEQQNTEAQVSENVANALKELGQTAKRGNRKNNQA